MSQNCMICLGQHDDEVHAATVRVHEWFRMQVRLSFDGPGELMLNLPGDIAASQLDAA
jgi:hypothetical protein